MAKEKQTAEQIVERGYGLGYSNIRVRKGGRGVEWGEPFYRNMAWEALVRRRLDDVIAYLRKTERAQKAKKKTAAKMERETIESLAAKIENLRSRIAYLEERAGMGMQ
jgi:Lon protease-like protein